MGFNHLVTLAGNGYKTAQTQRWKSGNWIGCDVLATDRNGNAYCIGQYATSTKPTQYHIGHGVQELPTLGQVYQKANELAKDFARAVQYS